MSNINLGRLVLEHVSNCSCEVSITNDSSFSRDHVSHSTYSYIECTTIRVNQCTVWVHSINTETNHIVNVIDLEADCYFRSMTLHFIYFVDTDDVWLIQVPSSDFRIIRRECTFLVKFDIEMSCGCQYIVTQFDLERFFGWRYDWFCNNTIGYTFSLTIVISVFVSISQSTFKDRCCSNTTFPSIFFRSNFLSRILLTVFKTVMQVFYVVTLIVYPNEIIKFVFRCSFFFCECQSIFRNSCSRNIVTISDLYSKQYRLFGWSWYLVSSITCFIFDIIFNHSCCLVKVCFVIVFVHFHSP